MRQGLILTSGSVRGDVALIQRAERNGFATALTIEFFNRNGFVPLAAAAPATSRIQLGTGIANSFTRAPLLLASAGQHVSPSSIDFAWKIAIAVAVTVLGWWTLRRVSHRFEHEADVLCADLVREVQRVRARHQFLGAELGERHQHAARLERHRPSRTGRGSPRDGPVRAGPA